MSLDEFEDQTGQPNKDQGSSVEPVPVKKRGRGRPRKDGSDLDPAASPVTSNTVPPVAKKRGRPPKEKHSATELVVNLTSDLAESEKQLSEISSKIASSEQKLKSQVEVSFVEPEVQAETQISFVESEVQSEIPFIEPTDLGVIEELKLEGHNDNLLPAKTISISLDEADFAAADQNKEVQGTIDPEEVVDLLRLQGGLHKVKLDNIKYIEYGALVVDIENGTGKITSDDGKPKPISYPKPKPLLVLKNQKKRFYLLSMAVAHLLDIKLDNFIVRAITAAVRFPFIHPKGEVYAIEKSTCQSILPYEIFSGSREGIMSEFWKCWFKSFESKQIIFVADDLDNIKRYVYSKSVPTYKEISELEALVVVKTWIKQVMPLGVSSIDTVGFYKTLLQYLATEQPISIDKFYSMMPVGAFFKDGAATLEPGNKQIKLLEYNQSIVTPKRVINSNFVFPSFKVDNEGHAKIAMGEDTINFLRVICGSDNYNLNVLRVFLRNVITAKYEGRNWQSALYLYGAPGTSKSMWIELIKSLIPPEQVQEFSRTQNQFSASQLKHCSVLIVSDLQLLLKQHTDVFRRILGRDQLTFEEKYVQGFDMIEPYCQVMIVSNEPPQSYTLFSEDQALLDKLIRVYLGPELQIPTDLQVADMREHLNPYMSDIFNWSVHVPKAELQHFIRAVDLNMFFDQAHNETLTGLPAFLMQCMCFGKDDDFVPTSDIKAAFINWLEIQGELSATSKGLGLLMLGKAIENLFANTFGVNCKMTRMYIKGKDRTSIRPHGFKGMRCTDGKTYANVDDKYLLKIKSSGRAMELPDPFSSDQVVTWFQNPDDDSTRVALASTQREILERREKALQLPSSSSSGINVIKEAKEDEESNELPPVTQDDLFNSSELSEF